MNPAKTPSRPSSPARPAFLLAILLALAITAAACGSGDATQTTPTLNENPTGVAGSALPVFNSNSGQDAAIGSPAPLITGTDILNGEPIDISESIQAGRPLMIGFYAHWCPHCQTEVPAVVGGLNSNPLPEGVDFVAISTFEDATRGNHPPAAWFRREGWDLPVISDTRGGAVAEVYGVQSVPFLVLVDVDGNVASRLPGSVGANSLQLLATQLIDGVVAEVETDPNASSSS